MLNNHFSVHAFWKRIADEKVNVVSVVPTMLKYLLEQADINTLSGHSIFGGDLAHEDFTHFRHFICGAEPCRSPWHGILRIALA